MGPVVRLVLRNLTFTCDHGFGARELDQRVIPAQLAPGLEQQIDHFPGERKSVG